MKYPTTLLTVFLLASTVEAWGKAGLGEQPAVVKTSDSPFNDDQQWFVKESLLIWHPFEDGLDFGAKYQSSSESETKVSVQTPDFEWGTGVKLTAGRYLPNHQLWDVTLAMTYFYAEAKRTSHANLANSQVIASAFQSTILGDEITQAKARWQLNYFLWDLDIARSYLMTPKVVVHPHLGLRTALIYLDFKNQNQSPDITYTKLAFNSTNTMWGIGPRLGTDFSFNFKTNWSFIGNLGAALLYSNFALKESFNGANAGSPISVHADRSYNFLTTNLEAAIGLGWEQWVRKDTVRIATSFLFEASEWFNMNRLFHLETIDFQFGSTDIPFSTPRYNRGDLGLIGFSINLQVDF